MGNETHIVGHGKTIRIDAPAVSFRFKDGATIEAWEVVYHDSNPRLINASMIGDTSSNEFEIMLNAAALSLPHKAIKGIVAHEYGHYLHVKAHGARWHSRCLDEEYAADKIAADLVGKKCILMALEATQKNWIAEEGKVSEELIKRIARLKGYSAS